MLVPACEAPGWAPASYQPSLPCHQGLVCIASESTTLSPMWTVNNNASRDAFFDLSSSPPHYLFSFTARSCFFPLGGLFPKAREQTMHNRVQTVPFQIVVLNKSSCTYNLHKHNLLFPHTSFQATVANKKEKGVLLFLFSSLTTDVDVGGGQSHHEQDNSIAPLENLLNKHGDLARACTHILKLHQLPKQ